MTIVRLDVQLGHTKHHIAKGNQMTNHETSHDMTVFQTTLAMSTDNNEMALYDTLMAYPIIETNRVGTAATDGVVILVNPKTFAGWTHAERCGVMFHEALHNQLDHHRRGELVDDHQRANIAMDCEINPIVEMVDGFKIPSGCVWPENYGMTRGKIWEHYYANMPTDDDDQNGDDGDNAESGDGDADADGGADGSGEPIANGNHATGELAKQFDVEPENGSYSADATAKAEDTADAVDEITNGGHLPGTSAACDTIEVQPVTVVPDGKRWQSVVVDAVRRGTTTRVDWGRPRRTSHHLPCYVPGKRVEHNNVSAALVIDISGSCSRHIPTWHALASEMVDNVPELDRVEIIMHNYTVVRRITWNRRTNQPIKVPRLSGGGTSHRWLVGEIQRHDVDVCILFSDNRSFWNGKPKCKVVSVVPHSGCPACPVADKTIAIA